MDRCRLISAILIASALIAPASCPAASGQDADFSAGIAPPAGADAAPPCDTPLCAVLAPHDLWKRDAVPKFSAETLNEDAIVLDRARRAELDERFTETPKLEVRIGNTSCFVGPTPSSAWNGSGNVDFLRFLHCGF